MATDREPYTLRSSTATDRAMDQPSSLPEALGHRHGAQPPQRTSPHPVDTELQGTAPDAATQPATSAPLPSATAGIPTTLDVGQMLAALTQAVTALALAQQQQAPKIEHPPTPPAPTPRWKPALKKFSGAEHESPEEFAAVATEHLLDMAIEERHWTAYLLEHGLQGDAATWATTHADARLDHNIFFKRLVDHYSHSSRYTRLLAKLYGHRQKQETAADFITHKMALFNRVAPATPDENRCRIIIDQLRPEIRQFLRANPPRSE
ncbi:unnamed protein product [Diabrotica balteata]|uniref:Retrotransposon gag domain-containing protein n=1 Tax=Diabrotica balteata TaxID=107213 RepID=A0A9N9TDM6_DIABA|nr:unnamed protein product [Diabrotica balteata]